MPCLWVANADSDAVDGALREDSTVERIIGTDEFGTEKYYHIEWTAEVVSRLSAYVDEEGSVIHAHATGTGWEVRFRFVSREQFDAFRDQLRAGGYAFDLLKLVEPGPPRQSTVSLTPPQRDALVVALERGYYSAAGRRSSSTRRSPHQPKTGSERRCSSRR